MSRIAELYYVTTLIRCETLKRSLLKRVSLFLQLGEAGGEFGGFDFDVVQIFFGTGFAAVADDGS